jgi:hypothetical protein
MISGGDEIGRTQAMRFWAIAPTRHSAALRRDRRQRPLRLASAWTRAARAWPARRERSLQTQTRAEPLW